MRFARNDQAKELFPVQRLRCVLGDRSYDADGFRDAQTARGINPASRQIPIAKCSSRTTAPSTGSATKSKTCLAG